MGRVQRHVWMAAGLLALLAPSVRAEEIPAADRAKVVQYLTTTRDQVLAEADTLTDAQWAFKAAPDRWSVGEVVEHLALAFTSRICPRCRSVCAAM